MRDDRELAVRVAIAQVVFLVDQLAEFGSPLIDVAHDAAQFYDLPDGWRLPATSDDPPVRILPSFSVHFAGEEPPARAHTEFIKLGHERIASIKRAAAAGSGQFNQALLGPLVHALLERDATSVVLTDLPITPPPEWRYIIWDSAPNGSVISCAPLDPAYWTTAVDEQTRIETTKKRALAATLCVIGSLLGLGRCSNERCFMFGNIDSVRRLDEVELIGSEHSVEELSGRTLPSATT